MRKKHYVVPRTHGQRTVAGGPMEIVTVYEPVCNHSGQQVNGTTDEALVTCTRCQHYLTHGRPQESYRCTLGESTGRWEIRTVALLNHYPDTALEDAEECNEIINPKGETCAYIHDDALAEQFCAWANRMTRMRPTA